MLPLSQHSMFVLSSLAYHDYEGVALNEDEKPRLVRDLGDKRFLMLRNHGLLTIGRTVARGIRRDVLLRGRLHDADPRAERWRTAAADSYGHRRERASPMAEGDARCRQQPRVAGAATQARPRRSELRVLTQMLKAIALVAILLALSGCADRTPDLSAVKMELAALRQEMEYIRYQTEELDPRVSNSEQMALQVINDHESPSRLDCVEHKAGIVVTRIATLPAICDSTLDYPGGHRIRLKLGNPTSGRLEGLRLTVYAGPGAAQGRSALRISYRAVAALLPGSWTPLEIDFPGLDRESVTNLAVRGQVEEIVLGRRP